MYVQKEENVSQITHANAIKVILETIAKIYLPLVVMERNLLILGFALEEEFVHQTTIVLAIQITMKVNVKSLIVLENLITMLEHALV
jgi:hypothetical protein